MLALRPTFATVSSTLIVLGALACATGSDDGSDDAFITGTSTTSPSTTDPVTTNPVTTEPDPSTVSNAEDSMDESTSAAPRDVPGECMPGELECPCDDGACIEPAVCEAGTCVEAIECDVDPNEPNEYDDEATDLGEISDDDAETVEFAGVLDGDADVDWFTYHGTDIFGETVDPARTLTVVGGTLELCKFFTCDVGDAQVICPVGTMGVTEGTRDGCCSSAAFGFDEDGIECVGGAFETGGTVLIRVRNASGQCVGYSGTAHF